MRGWKLRSASPILNLKKDYFGKESFEEGRLFHSESVQEWFQSRIETVPVCYFEKVKAVGYTCLLLTHLSTVVAGITFLRQATSMLVTKKSC